MTEKRASLEIIAPTIEEAVAKGLDELGLPEDAVEVEILDSGSRGLFGIGSRHARVRLTIRSASTEATQASSTAAPAAQPTRVKEYTSQPAAPQSTVSEELELAEPEYEEMDYPGPAGAEYEEMEAEYDEPAISTPLEQRVEGDEETLRVARDTVVELLDKMKIKATVTAAYGEAEDQHSKTPVMVDVRGGDLSILIGPRAETLNALQYISALIIGKELGRSIPLVVDVEGYRARRSQQLRQLARRMADQAIKTGKRQVLEPMPANERRLIHIELRSNPDVETQSIGEEPRRKVTIVPVK